LTYAARVLPAAVSHAATSRRNRAAISAIAAASSIRPSSHAAAASKKIVRPTANVLRARRDLEAAGELLLRRLETEEHDPATARIRRIDHPVDVVPGVGRLLRLELPPVGLDAQSVEPLNNARDGIVAARPDRAGDDLDHQLATDGPRRVEDPHQLTLLTRLEIVIVVGVIEAQAFDRVEHRPLDQVRAEIAAAFDVERTGARLFDRPTNPERMTRRFEKRFGAVGAID
jgi:hypothetical protein